MRRLTLALIAVAMLGGPPGPRRRRRARSRAAATWRSPGTAHPVTRTHPEAARSRAVTPSRPRSARSTPPTSRHRRPMASAAIPRRSSRARSGGMRADGRHLYPAMPYAAYTKLSDGDVAALYAYFMKGVKPVEARAPATRLPFPFNLRWTMGVWNALFFHDGRFHADRARSAAWNRGAYLAEALEHCSDCHTPRNVLMGRETGRAYAGGPIGSWYAPNITSDAVSGVGGWSHAELVQYLRSGVVHGKRQAAGGMAEAVANSLQHLSDQDLSAIATYIKPSGRFTGVARPPPTSAGARRRVWRRWCAATSPRTAQTATSSTAAIAQAATSGTARARRPGLSLAVPQHRHGRAAARQPRGVDRVRRPPRHRRQARRDAGLRVRFICSGPQRRTGGRGQQLRAVDLRRPEGPCQSP